MKLFLVEFLKDSSCGTFSVSPPSTEEKPDVSVRHSSSSDSCGNFILNTVNTLLNYLIIEPKLSIILWKFASRSYNLDIF